MMPVCILSRAVLENQPFRSRFVLVVALFAVMLVPIRSWAQEDDDVSPGVEARYSVGSRAVTRVDPEINFVWGKAAPDPRLPAGPFTAVWTTTILIRQPGRYRLYAYTIGQVTVALDGKPVLSGIRREPGWISGGDITLGFGEKPLEVTFRKTESTTQLRLFWSSDRFPLEPLPIHQLYREEGNPAWKLFERGRQAFAAHRCNRCHRRANEPIAPPAPALTHLRGSLSRRWLAEKIRAPHSSRSDARMPSFGFSTKQADAVAAFLLSQSRTAELQHPVLKARNQKPRRKKGGKKAGKPLTPRQRQRQGKILFRSTGCLACHMVEKAGTTGPYTGGDLSRIGSKRSRDWLYTWLARPAVLNADHRMPLFRLTDAERANLAAYLSSLGRNRNNRSGGATLRTEPSRRDNPAGDTKRLVAEGRRLVLAARCAACHRINGLQADWTGIPDLSRAVANWAQSCVQDEADAERRRPGYPGVDRAALRAYITSRLGDLSPESPSARGLLVLRRRNCLQCHERGLTKGIVPIAGKMARIDSALAGQSQRMIPPALTAVGDKLKDAVLAEAVSGRQKQRRLPWLMVRMPRFEHSADDRTALVRYLIDRDRIPQGAPGESDPRSAAGALKRSQALVAGQTLIGPRGFSCTGCHILGDFHPRNVALGTRGSDLAFLGRRMRREFFTRWVRSPLRILPGTEMPSYIKPVAGVLDGQSKTQLAATWEALNDPRFKPPTDPSAVEQLLAVAAGHPARIVRDVFTNPKENGGGFIARALAIGLNNGHNILFDLDRFAVRGWTFGEFARQRTQGKSWYWDLAGLPVMTGFGSTSDFALRRRSGSEKQPIPPASQYGSNGRLRGYRSDGDGVAFEYLLWFKVDGSVRSIPVRERIRPIHSHAGKRTGWERQVTANLTGLSGFDLMVSRLVSRPQPKSSAGSPTIVRRKRDGGKQTSSTSAGWFVVQADSAGESPGNADRRTVTLRYFCSLEPERAALKIKPKPPVTKIRIDSVPGFDGTRLPLNPKIMPTAMTWTADGHLAFTSLEGHVYIAHDRDGDGVEETLTMFEEGLAAPYGIIADGRDLIVAHKPELLRLRDTDGDGHADRRIVLATGWGYTDNYHDWTCGIVRDSKRNLYVGLGSDYAQPERPKEAQRWRGTLLKIDPRGKITPLGFALRYPTGLAIDSHDRLFVSDNQGVQNTFNEINYLMPGHHYGVPSRNEIGRGFPETPPAIQVPHPWTRSVNGLTILPSRFADRALAGAGLGCEYNGRFLVRFTYEQVAGTMQGAVYPFSRSGLKPTDPNFLGPLSIAVSPAGDLYVGSIYDSGWLGGRNTGEIVRLRPNGRLPNGIRELRARPDGFEIEFFAPVNRKTAARSENYTLSAYTRVWKGGYATPDSGRHAVPVKSVSVADDAKTVRLHIGPMHAGDVYDITCGRVGTAPNPALWPDTGHYTLHRIPPSEEGTDTAGGSR